MKPYQIFFKIDNIKHECLVIEDSEEKAVEYLKQEFLGVEIVDVFLVENRMMVEMSIF